MMDEIIWQKAFNSGRAYGKLLRLRIDLSQYLETVEDCDLVEKIIDIRDDVDDAMTFLDGGE